MLPLILLLVAGGASSTAEASGDGCRVGCPLALASYYFSAESNLTFIASLFNFSDYTPLLPYNPNITDPNYVLTGTRVSVPFNCSCRALPADPASTFLSGSLPHPLSRGQTYADVAAEFANLTTAAWLEATNAYPADKLPASGTINATVNCSCGDKSVSPRYGLFLTYPLWDGETLASAAEQYGFSSPGQMELLRRYNPGMDGASGKGIVFIPVKDTDGSYRPLESAVGNSLSGGAVAGIVITCIVILIVGIWLFAMFYRRQKMRKSISFSSPEDSVQLASASQAEGIKVDRSIEFSYEELSEATDNFSMEHKIGQGGYGSVYYAELRGEKAAIKKMDTKASQEFFAELKVLTHVHHLNLVRLIGFCVESCLFLVYEFIENGTARRTAAPQLVPAAAVSFARYGFGKSAAAAAVSGFWRIHAVAPQGVKASMDADEKNAVTPSNPPKAENGSASEIILDEFDDLTALSDSTNDDSTVSITVVGASGDLAKKKIFPALFALYYEDCLPKHFTIFGYARSKMTDAELRNMVSKTLTCRIDKRENCSEKMEEFLKRCFYHSGQYDSEEHFVDLDKKLKQHEGPRVSNRLFYLSIPPNIFLDVVKCASKSASSVNGWTRVIVEKPFGRDSESSAALTRGLKQYLVEDQIFRIDHYLGKELVENLSVLRFSNLVFEPLWSRQYIRNVQIIFSEDFGTEGRGGYFDSYGIIRDIMQNHLLQILALFAMETPISLEAEDIRNEKVKVLRSMKPLQLEDVVIGQYKSHTKGGTTYPGYTDDKTVPKDSVMPTFAAAALFINNARWDGVPFLMKAGKALHTRRTEIRVQFRHVPGNLYKGSFGTDLDRATNELVIRVQPDEAIYLKINNKIPGLGMRLDRSNLNLHYAARYSKEIPDAYERLLLDAIEGERRLFIRSDELDAAWSLFTPLLKELEDKRIAPELYPYGSRGPVGAHYLAAKYNVRWGDLSAEHYKA